VSIVAVSLIVAGLFFLMVSAFGLVRFPDFYTRAHVVAKSETLGMIFVILGVMVHHRFAEGSLRLLLLVAFAAIANPTAIHALARAAHSEDDGRYDPPVPARRPAGGEEPA
jgi:multicomponent Na+:H+ antiporter subunit G